MSDPYEEDVYPWADEDPRLATASSEWRADQVDRYGLEATDEGPGGGHPGEPSMEADAHHWFG